MPSLLDRAVLELGINVPILDVLYTPGTVVILCLADGHKVPWDPATPPAEMPVETDPSSPGADPVTTPDADSDRPNADSDRRADFTAIPGIGPAGAAALQEAGYTTFQQLAAAGDNLKPLLNTYTLTKLRDYLYTHGYLEDIRRPS